MSEREIGAVVKSEITRMAHGGEGIATAPDGRVIFARGGFPGDEVDITLTEVKKNYARGVVTHIHSRGQFHSAPTCEAAEAGAGCCDFSRVDPELEIELKAEVLIGQLSRKLNLGDLPDLEIEALEPKRGWRTRVRLGVDEQGRAGFRKVGSRELVTDHLCSQVVPGLLDGLVGPGSRRFTPGAEVIAVMDGAGKGSRHVVETTKAARGKRVENVEEVLEGAGNVTENVDGIAFEFPATAFWQAHVGAPQAYSEVIRSWLPMWEDDSPRTAWDLYGGVGLFVPVLADSFANGRVISVDYSPAANAPQPGLARYNVQKVNEKVERIVDQLPKPDVVVLDPPRTGAGRNVIAATASKQPSMVIHVGCDPATFARDMEYWSSHGYHIDKLRLIDAFGGTHHFEVIAALTKEISTES